MQVKYKVGDFVEILVERQLYHSFAMGAVVQVMKVDTTDIPVWAEGKHKDSGEVRCYWLPEYCMRPANCNSVRYKKKRGQP